MGAFVIVGGDAAGMSAANKAKRDDPDIDVVAFEKGKWATYGACGLPYYIKGEIQSLDDLASVTPERVPRAARYRPANGHKVIDLHPKDRTVTARHNDGETVHEYDHLLVATGAEAVEHEDMTPELSEILSMRVLMSSMRFRLA